MRELYIIGEFHPYYELYNPRLPEEFRRTLKNIVEMEETFLRWIKPDRVFVEYPESWGLKEELKYRARSRGKIGIGEFLFFSAFIFIRIYITIKYF